MKPFKLLITVAALAAAAGCDQASNGGNGAPSGPAQTVAPPQGQTWEQVVTKTAEGGYLMGNPNAPVKLIEFGSMTCPHCADFDDNVDELVEDYVKTGQVSFEFRNYVRDGLDMAMALVARCGGPERFFPLTHALFDSQEQLFEQVQSTPPQQQQTLSQSPQGFGQLAGLQQWAAQRGLPSARTQACLTNQQEIDQLVQMNADANQQFAIPGTPAFAINGELVENASTWDALEPKLRDAL
jgi:protein-disulfide isomerase